MTSADNSPCDQEPAHEKKPARDKDGYLVDLSCWQPEVAEWLAQQENITLTVAHWEIITALRAFYATFDHAPNNRALVKYCAQNLGADKISSAYIMNLFGGTPAKTAAKIAGLPRPTHCL